MTRIQTATSPSGKSQELLSMVEKKLGRVPNMMKTLAHSPVALELYLTMSGILGGSSIPAKDQERLALLSAEKNSCGYCNKAHAAIGKGAGLTDSEIAAARSGEATNPRTAAMLTFAAAVLEKKGRVSDQEFAAAKSSGLSDAEILEVIGVTCLNIYTNYVNQVADTVIDF